MNVKSLKQRALCNPQFKAEYDKLDIEFTLIDQSLSMRGKLQQMPATTKINFEHGYIIKL